MTLAVLLVCVLALCVTASVSTTAQPESTNATSTTEHANRTANSTRRTTVPPVVETSTVATSPPPVKPPPAPARTPAPHKPSKKVPKWAIALVVITVTITLCALGVLVLVTFGYNVPFYGRVGHVDMKVRHAGRVPSDAATEGTETGVQTEGGKAIMSSQHEGLTSVNPTFGSEYECRQITEIDENRGGHSAIASAKKEK